MAQWESCSLTFLFKEATLLYETVERKYEEEKYTSCCAMLEECERRVSALGLFSRNETFEDLQTSSIRFLSVEYYRGKTSALFQTKDLKMRLEHLESAKVNFETFLSQARQYSLLDEETANLIRPASDPTLIRELKIARLKQISSLRRQYEESNMLLDGEDVERERAVTLIRRLAIEASSELEGMQVEMELLRNRQFPNEIPDPKPRIPTGSASKITEPFILLRDRQQMARNVFRPGHSLPTMTIDEYLALERQRGGIISSSNQQEIEEDEDCDTVADRKTEKDRRFDIIKDENPRGWGNTFNLS